MNVTVVAHTHDAKTDQGAHVERQDGNEQRLHTFQVTVEEDGHEHNLQGGQKVILNPVTVVECSSEGKRVRGPDLGHHIRDGGGAYDHAVLVLEKNPGMNPRLKKNKTKQRKGINWSLFNENEPDFEAGNAQSFPLSVHPGYKNPGLIHIRCVQIPPFHINMSARWCRIIPLRCSLTMASSRGNAAR